MPYLLNFIYLGLIAAAGPWLVYQAIRKGKYFDPLTVRDSEMVEGHGR